MNLTTIVLILSLFYIAALIHNVIKLKKETTALWYKLNENKKSIESADDRLHELETRVEQIYPHIN